LNIKNESQFCFSLVSIEEWWR